MKNLIELFNANPTQKEVHTTSDGYNFWDAHFAEAHARTLTNQDVTTTTRKQALASIEVANAETVTAPATPTPKAPKEPKATKEPKEPKEPAKAPEAPATPVAEPAKEPVKEETAEAPATETPKTEV